jgi:UDP-glucose 4-epimerase
MTEPRRVLVTGGAGFVGATLVRRLAGSGHQVRVLDNYSTGDPSYLDGVGAELVEGDIRDVRALDAALAGVDAVVHLAAAGSVITSVADPAANFDVNVTGTFRVLDAARRAGVQRTVQASTGGALIGDATPPVTERSLPKPISPYGASKLAGEGYAHAFAAAYGLRTVALRFANVYGPWSARKPGAITLFFRAIQAGEPIVIYGDGSASRTTPTWRTSRGRSSWPWSATSRAAPRCTSRPASRRPSGNWPTCAAPRPACRIIRSSTGPDGPAR